MIFCQCSSGWHPAPPNTPGRHNAHPCEIHTRRGGRVCRRHRQRRRIGGCHPAADGGSAAYQVIGPDSFADVNAIAATGAAVDGVEHGRVHITATRAEVRQIRALGFQVEAVPQPDVAAEATSASSRSRRPTPATTTTPRWWRRSTRSSRRTRPSRRSSSIGTSYEGRDMPLIKISDNVGTDENEPEILFNAHQHAREHLTVEMALYILHLLIDGYGIGHPDHQPGQQPRVLDRPGHEPGRRRVRHRHRRRTGPGARTASRTPVRPMWAPT